MKDQDHRIEIFAKAMFNPGSRTFAAIIAFGITASSAHAALILSATGTGAETSLGNAQTQWGTIDHTTSSVIVETTFDFTAAADAATVNLPLWEFGAGVGSNLVIVGDDIYAASDSFSTQGAHGLSSPTVGVQIVTLFDFENDLLAIYVNGVKKAENTSFTETDWAGTDPSRLTPPSNLGGIDPAGTLGQYPDAANANFSINVYTVNASVDGAGTSLGSVLIPEPSSLALLGLGSLLIASRRRRD